MKVLLIIPFLSHKSAEVSKNFSIYGQFSDCNLVKTSQLQKV